MPKYIIVKMQKTEDRDKISKVSEEKWQITFKGSTMRLTVNFFFPQEEITKAGRQ